MIKNAMDKRSKDTNDKARILIVDDEESARRSISLIFRVKGYEAETASTGREALEKARERFFNVTLLDIRLPDMEGIDLLAPLKKMHPDMAVIMATGYASMETSVRSLHNGASAYITKPLNMDEVLNRVKEALEKQRLVFDNRRLIKELQQELVERKKAEEEIREKTYELGERLKELNCLYEVSRLMTEPDISLEAALQKAVNLIQLAWQYPEITCARISFGEKVLKTGNFSETAWKQSADIKVLGKKAGAVDVYYLKEKPEIYEGPFFKEERDLIDALARVMGEFIERKQAEEALRDREGSYRELANSITDIFFAMDEDLRYTYWNKASEKLTGVAAKDALGKSLYDIFPHVKGTKAEEMYLKVLKTRRPQHFINNFGLRAKDYFFEINAYPSKGGISVFARDITERTKAEEALQESEEKYRTLTENINVGVYRNTIGLQGKFIEANPAIIKMFGYKSKKEFMAIKVSDLYQYPADRKKFNDVMLKQRFAKDKELLLKKKDGTPFIGSVSAKAVKDKTGNVLYYDGIIEDITRRKEAEEKLRESEKRFKAIFDNARDGMLLTDIKGKKFLTGNKMISRMLGYNQEEIKNLGVMQIHPEEDLPYVIEQFEQQSRKKITLARNIPVKRKDGSIFYADINSSPIRLDSKTYLLGIFRDITEHRQMQEALRKSEEKYRTIFENTGLATVIIEEDTILSLVNDKFERLSGYSQNEIEGKKSWTEFVVKEDLERMKKYHRERRVDKASAPNNYEFRFIDRSGNIRDIFLSIAIIPGTKSSVGSLLDITENRRAEEALRKSEASLAEAQRIALLGSWEWDIINDQIIGSLQFYRIFNMEPNEFGTRLCNLLDKIHPEDREFVEKSLCKTFDKRKSFTIHYRICLPDGSERIIRKQAEVIVNEAGKAIRMVGTVQDITERIALEQQLIQSEKLASLGHLAAGIAHEINNPLGFISSNLSTLDEYVQDIKKYIALIEKLDNTVLKEPDKLTGFLDEVQQEKEKLEIDLILNDMEKMKVETRDGVNRISSLVKDLKRFAHPMEESPHLANINDLIDTSLNLVKNELKYKAKVIEDYGDIPSIKCYPQQLNQVFNNILINAAQAIKEKGEVGIKTFSENESICIQIKDNGEGIAKENITKIFDPFFTTKKVGIGTGLGLSISLRIIEKHKGSINVQSTVGKGTTFTIKLPIKGLS
jgi:PAS domain S-box-containing protein